MIQRRHPITPHSRSVAMCSVQPETVSLPGTALTREATRRLRFVVHAAGDFTPWCSTDADVVTLNLCNINT